MANSILRSAAVAGIAGGFLTLGTAASAAPVTYNFTAEQVYALDRTGTNFGSGLDQTISGSFTFDDSAAPFNEFGGPTVDWS